MSEFLYSGGTKQDSARSACLYLQIKVADKLIAVVEFVAVKAPKSHKDQ
jgi:hypothetical protein